MQKIVENKKVLVDYEILDKFEAGISLLGWEVKSIKNSKISLTSAFVRPINGEVYLVGAIVYSWKFALPVSPEIEKRDRKLLLKKSEIRKLENYFKQSNISIVPLSVYTEGKGLIKVTIGVGKGRKKFDKRNKLKEKDLQRRTLIDIKNFR